MEDKLLIKKLRNDLMCYANWYSTTGRFLYVQSNEDLIEQYFQSMITQQIGCGYCVHEKTCKIRDPKINKAKTGCKNWKHFMYE